MPNISLYLFYSFVATEKWEMIMNIKSCALFISDEQSNVNGNKFKRTLPKLENGYSKVHIYDVETLVIEGFGI